MCWLFQVLGTYSVFILSVRKKKKFPRSPSGLLIRTTRKETRSCVTPIHLPHAGTHARRHTAPRARLLLSGPGAGARGHRSQSSGGAGRSYDPGSRVLGGSRSGVVGSGPETWASTDGGRGWGWGWGDTRHFSFPPNCGCLPRAAEF